MPQQGESNGERKAVQFRNLLTERGWFQRFLITRIAIGVFATLRGSEELHQTINMVYQLDGKPYYREPKTNASENEPIRLIGVFRR